MARGWQDVRRIHEPIITIGADDSIVTPSVINATDVEQNLDFSADPVTGFILQNLGPELINGRVNGTAGLGDGEFSFQLKKNEWISFSNVVINKISVICEAAKTAKVIIQPVREP